MVSVPDGLSAARESVRAGLAEALGALIFLVAVSLPFWVLTRRKIRRLPLRWYIPVALLAVGLPVVLVALLIAFAFDGLPTHLLFLDPILSWPTIASVPNGFVAILTLLAVLKLWDWRLTFRTIVIVSIRTSLAALIRGFRAVVEWAMNSHSSLAAVPSHNGSSVTAARGTQSAISVGEDPEAVFFRRIAGYWHLRYRDSQPEDLRIDETGNYFVKTTSDAQAIRVFTLRNVQFDSITGTVAFDKVDTGEYRRELRAGHVRQRESLKLSPNNCLMEGHGPDGHRLLYRRVQQWCERPTERPVEDLLLNTTFRLYWDGTSHSRERSKVMRFGSNGAIVEGGNENESSWRFERGFLEFLDTNGAVFSRFQFCQEESRFRLVEDPDTYVVKNTRFRGQYMVPEVSR